MVTSHLRFAAGVCALTAGLLMGGGAVAVADPDSSGSAAHGDDGTNASVQGSTTASSPVGNVTDTLGKTIQGVTSTLGSGRQPGQQPSTGAKSPKKEPGGTDTDDEKKGSVLAAVPNVVPPVADVVAPVPEVVAPVPDVVAPVPDVVAPVADVVAPDADVVAPVPDVVAPVPDVVAPVPDVVAPVPDVVAPVPDVVAPVPDVVAPAPDVVAPVPDVVAPVPDVVAPVPDVVAPVPDVVTPISDIIVFLKNMLTAAASAVVPLTQLQCDLFSWFSSLFGIASVQPVVVGLGGAAGAGLSEASADASVAPQSPLVRALAGIRGVPLAGKATGVAAPEGIAAFTFGAMTQIGRASPLAGVAPLAPNGAIPTDVQPFFRDACELLIRVSLWTLAAAALPGLGGLLILTATGVRIGYRQAKAGFAVRPAGIASFAPAGALGAVRSGSLIVVHPRALRVVRPGVSAGCLLDEVA